jgi:putative transcriptional regulator
MIEVLQNKNSATRFQILVEIAASGPNIHQKTVAAKLGITPQAVSDYMRQMVSEEMLVSTGRSNHRVSAKGVNWVLKMLRELNEYVPAVTRAVTNLTVCAAIAEADLNKGQPVGLEMKDGLLVATIPTDRGAKGIAMSSSKRGEDVDVGEIEGLVDFTRGNLEILQIPSIARGGSKKTDIRLLKARTNGRHLVGAIGIEALVALRKINIEPRYLYGVIEAAVEAVHCGLSFIIVCTDDAVPDLINKLREEKLEFEVTDLALISPPA